MDEIERNDGSVEQLVNVYDYLPPTLASSPLTGDRRIYWHLYEKMRDIEVVRVFMTPEWAKELLDKSPYRLEQRQRRINQKNLKKLKRDIVGGRYQVTHQGVALSREQAIVDGQHRLLACYETGICIPMFLFRNVLQETIWAVDRGAIRTVDQDLYMHGIDKGNERAAMLRRCIEVLGYESTNIRDKQEHDVWLTLFGEGIEFALTLNNRLKKTAGSSPVVGGFAFAHPVNPARVEECGKRFISGANMTENDPMLRLRNHCAMERNRNRGQRPQALLLRATTYALYKALTNKPVHQLRRNMDGVYFFRKYYMQRFPEEIKRNTFDTALKLGPKTTKKTKKRKKKIDDYEE